ncbi:hypothetical protein [Chryseobacterium sp. SIMBA_029]|uniref:hypothetical protein n=1 Tax=Chryseobacterium sp. SIMBA_029 TaxID=3085772 RepID=UPI0039792070
MKHLFIALICTLIGFSASASDLTPKKNLPLPNKVEIKITSKENKIYVAIASTKNNSQTISARRQKKFLLEDACGQMWIIYVSGPDNVSDSTMYYVARNAFANGFDNDGCFNGL